MRVAIVGAGPTGLMAANLLGQAGVDTLVLEQNPGLSTIPRAITIDDEGFRICQAIGIAETLGEHCLLNISAHYISRKRYIAHVTPMQQPNGYPLISTFHQPEFEQLLYHNLKRFPGVEIRFQHTLEVFNEHEHGVSLWVRKAGGEIQHVECAYLLACDGGKSAIRQALDIALMTPTLSQIFANTRSLQRSASKKKNHRIAHTQQWLVVDTADDTDTTQRILFYCDPARPAVTVPAPGQRRRWEFMLKAGEQPESLLQGETIRALMKQARDSIPPESGEQSPQTMSTTLVRYTIYTFYSSVATTLQKGRIFLLGDAAHLMPPFGGQGMNSGLRDAHNLCWKLSLINKELANPTILMTYEEERLPHIARMILFSSMLGKLIMPTNGAIAYARDWLLKTVNLVPPLRQQITEMQVKPQPGYHHGYLLPYFSPRHKKLSGSLFPQPIVMTVDGKRVKLDEMLGAGFSLLRLYEEPGLAFQMVQHEIWKQFATTYICIRTGNKLPTTGRAELQERANISAIQTAYDLENVITHLLHHDHEIFVLLRPDRYVMGIFHISEADKVARHLCHKQQ